MAKILADKTEKTSSKREFINREDYEYTLRNTFINGSIVVAVVSVYITFAYIVISHLTKSSSSIPITIPETKYTPEIK